MVHIELPWPPSINHYWIHTRNGHYISKKGKEYRQLVIHRCVKYKNVFKKEDRLNVNIKAYPPDKRKRDLDNVLKSLLDALQHAEVYHDDCQIDNLCISRNAPLNGEVDVVIHQIT